MSQLLTINEVLSELDSIVDTTLRENNPLGIFAWVYRRTTAKVAEGIREQRFGDNARMEEFDVAFAELYINAFYQFREQQSVSLAWEWAFAAGSGSSQNSDALIIQHLLLGMNAHINLDLGIAADRISLDGEIKALKEDFC